MEKEVKQLVAASSDHSISTAEIAAGAGVKEQSVRKRYCLTGSYFGVKPDKLANGRLRWPPDSIKRLTIGGGTK
jgi:hypothetical protein